MGEFPSTREESASVSTLPATSTGNRQTLDLNDVTRAQRFDLKVTQEHDDERASRLRREERREQHDLGVARIKLWALLAALFGVGLAATYTLIWAPNATADDRKWATSVLTALVTGAVGYVAGERAGKAKE